MKEFFEIDINNKPNNDFAKAFLQLLAYAPQQNNQQVTLKAMWMETLLGPMIAIADEKSLYLLEFFTKKGLEREINRLGQQGFAILPGNAPPLRSIQAELKAYFEGKLTAFTTPFQVIGSVFQQKVWEKLCQIPYGETISYAKQSTLLGKPTAYRAVANANGANQLSIIVPCHRVIASDGSLGGYSSGLALKLWLINHEKKSRLR